MKNYWLIRAEKAKREIRIQLDFVNNNLAVEAQHYLGKEFNSAGGWELSGKKWALEKALSILGNNNIYVD